MLLLLLCLWFGQGKKRPAKSETPANTQQHAVQNEASPIPQQNAGQTGNKGQQSQSDSARWSNPIVLLQLFLFFAVCVQAGVYVWQAVLMRKTLAFIKNQTTAMVLQAQAMVQ